ncbi:hypothetical protein MBVR141_0569 [Mycoplasmopsis bovirhinis]|uniref:hypothetical protein n=1 Tax=Mycoplasmopsis bovirhinis TaxID=29553 RepID=UPI000BB9E68C|nr:hypothetical protein [Mycoplasmopsis bovirhinis]BBA22380.1 hypothetical protein MBVR141_0569 [Mycoplasmopsis bovirhinis]
MNKIFINKLNPKLTLFLQLQGKKIISANNLINWFDNLYYERICNLVWKIYWLYGKYNIEIDEIRNQLFMVFLEMLYQDLIEDIDNYEAWFWNTLKLKTQNYFNKLYNSQYKFESNLSYNQMNLHELNSKLKREYNIWNGTYQTIDDMKKYISPEEYEFLQNKINFKHTRLSTWKQKEMIQAIKNKLNSISFFN